MPKKKRKTMVEPLKRAITNIATSQTVLVDYTTEETADAIQRTEQENQRWADSLKSRVNAECHRRCTEVANESGQLNLASKRATGLLPTEEHATHDALVQWINDMQAVARNLINAGDETYAEDRHWPEAPAGVGDLSKKY